MRSFVGQPHHPLAIASTLQSIPMEQSKPPEQFIPPEQSIPLMEFLPPEQSIPPRHSILSEQSIPPLEQSIPPEQSIPLTNWQYLVSPPQSRSDQQLRGQKQHWTYEEQPREQESLRSIVARYGLTLPYDSGQRTEDGDKHIRPQEINIHFHR